MVGRNVKEKVTGNTEGRGTGGQDLFHHCCRHSILVGQWHQDIHIVDGEEARVAVQHPLIPVVIDLIGQGDDIAFLEA